MLKTTDTPLYIQLKNELYDRVLSCEWRAGQKLPSENELIKAYNISRITVRQALSELQRDGVIVKKQGKGTFVNPQQAEHRRGSMYTFSRELRDMGLQMDTTLLDWQIASATPRIAAILKLEQGVQVLHLVRLRQMGSKPFALEHSYLPLALVTALTQQSVAQNGLYNSLQEQCMVIPQQATETFSAVLLNREQAMRLQAEENAAAFHLQRISECREQIVEYCSCIIRGDRYRLKFTLK